MSTRRVLPTQAPPANRLDVVLRAGLRRCVADMSVVSIDVKQDKGSLTKQSEPQQHVKPVIKKRHPIRTQERLFSEAGKDSDKPRAVRNDNAEHRRIYAVVCYTHLFDTILSDMIGHPTKKPFDLLMQMPAVPSWSPVWEAALAFFDLTEGYKIDAGAAIINNGCGWATLNYHNRELEDAKQEWLWDMKNVYDAISDDRTKYDALKSGQDVPDRNVDDMIKFVNGSLSRMMLEFKECFSPWSQWIEPSEGGASVHQPSFFAKKDVNGQSFCRARNVLFSGSYDNDVGISYLSERMLSTTYNVETAIWFTGTNNFIGKPPTGTLLVLVLDPEVSVVNVHAITSTLSDSFLCYGKECEIIVEPGCVYNRIEDFEEFEVHKKEWEEVERGLNPAKTPPKVEFYHVLPP